MLVSDEQSLKAPEPIVVMLAGIFMLVNDVQPLKAYEPIFFTLLGIVTEEIARFSNAWSAMTFTLSGITTSSD